VHEKGRVLLLSENFFPLSAASAQRLFAYAKAFTSHSYQTAVITNSQVNFRSEKLTVAGSSIKREIPIFNPILLALYFIKSASVIRKTHINLIISTVPKINNAIAGVLLSKLFRIPHVIDVRDLWELSLLSPPLNRVIPRKLVSLITKITPMIYRQANSIVTLNDTMKDMLVNQGILRDRIYILPNGADTSLFKPCPNEECLKQLRRKYGLPMSKLIFVYGGALSLENRLDIVLKGISTLRESEKFLFLIIGKPTLLITCEGLRQRAKQLGLENYVKVMDNLPPKRFSELVRCCDVGVVPIDDDEHLKHVMTSKIFTYLASGLPVLVSGPKGGELQMIVNTHKVGIFVGETTPEAFAAGFKDFLQKKNQLRKIGLRSRKIVERYYDRSTLSQKILQFAQEVT